jgi:hypothetical protein
VTPDCGSQIALATRCGPSTDEKKINAQLKRATNRIAPKIPSIMEMISLLRLLG